MWWQGWSKKKIIKTISVGRWEVNAVLWWEWGPWWYYIRALKKQEQASSEIGK